MCEGGRCVRVSYFCLAGDTEAYSLLAVWKVSPAFVAACDRLGVMLMEEAFDCWDQGKNSDDYHLYFDEWWQRDVKSMVMRDVNSPSIIMWSIGNGERPVGTSTYSKLCRDFLTRAMQLARIHCVVLISH